MILWWVRTFNELEVAGKHSSPLISRTILTYLAFHRQQVSISYNAGHNQSNSISLERVKQYLEIEHEPKPTPQGVPPAYWPASGDLKVEKLSARYSPVRTLFHDK